MKTYLPVDIETTSLDFNRGHILGIGAGENYSETARSIPPLPASCQNGRFEWKWLKKHNIPFNWAFDTLLAASILIDRPESLDLGTLASYYLGMPSWKDETDKLFKKKNWYDLYKKDVKLQEAMRTRNLYDLKATSALTERLQQKLREENMEEFFYEKLMPAARMLADVEYRGMRINLESTRQKLADIDQQLGTLLQQLKEWGGDINFKSPIQLKKLLQQKGYDLWIYDFKKREMVESTGSDALERLLPNTSIELLLNYRKTTKLKGFLEGWIEEHFEGRLFPSYNIASTRTGRLSCSAPNLQQVPRDPSIRSLFIPSEGKKFIIADYAQIEPRIAAHYTQDEALLEVFTEGLDFYGSIACRVLGAKCAPNEVKKLLPDTRKVAKEIGLSILYGIGAAKLSSLIKKKAGIEFTKEQAGDIIKDYFKAYPRLLEFRKYVENKVMKNEILRTHYGRQFKINPDKVFSTGVNTIIQATASDACLFSQLEIDKRLNAEQINAPLVAIVHDEVIRECGMEDADKVGKIMEEVMCNQGFNAPIKLDWVIGDNWGDKA